MTGLVRKATLLGVCGMLAAATAMANVPSRANSVIPQSNPGTCPPADPECQYGFINLVGTRSGANPGAADPAGAFTVTVNDFSNTPISGSRVIVDISNCLESRLCSYQIAGTTVNCSGPPARQVSAVTNGLGQVTFSVLGASTDNGSIPAASGGWPGSGAGCVTIFADGVDLGNETLVVFDKDGALGGANNGVNAADLGKFRIDLGAAGLFGTYFGRSDHNNDGSLNASDLGSYRVVLGNSGLGNGSLGGCADLTNTPQAYCP